MALIFCLRSPVGFDHQHHLGILWIVGPHGHFKAVRTIHPFMHHVLHREFGFLPRFNCRRTDDRLRRSATLYGFYLWLIHNAERPVALVAQFKRGANRGPQLLIAFINLSPVNDKFRRSGFRPIDAHDEDVA